MDEDAALFHWPCGSNPLHVAPSRDLAHQFGGKRVQYDGSMRLTNRTDYALRAALELAASGGPALTTSALGKAQTIPASYLGAVLGDL